MLKVHWWTSISQQFRRTTENHNFFLLSMQRLKFKSSCKLTIKLQEVVQIVPWDWEQRVVSILNQVSLVEHQILRFLLESMVVELVSMEKIIRLNPTVKSIWTIELHENKMLIICRKKYWEWAWEAQINIRISTMKLVIHSNHWLTYLDQLNYLRIIINLKIMFRRGKKIKQDLQWWMIMSNKIKKIINSLQISISRQIRRQEYSKVTSLWSKECLVPRNIKL